MSGWKRSALLRLGSGGVVIGEARCRGAAAVPDQRPFRATLAATLAYLGRRNEAAALTTSPTSVVGNLLGLFRNERDRMLMREGLRLAGARV